MDEQQNTTVDKAELVITVEMGDDFEPGENTAAALAALVDALNTEHGDDVVGFSVEPAAVRSFSFVSAPRPGTPSLTAFTSKWKGFALDGKSSD